MSRSHHTRIADCRHADCVSKPFERISYTVEMGRSRAKIRCPFCGGVTVAFLWSLPNGKRCDHCPAIFGRHNAYNLEQANVTA